MIYHNRTGRLRLNDNNDNNDDDDDEDTNISNTHKMYFNTAILLSILPLLTSAIPTARDLSSYTGNDQLTFQFQDHLKAIPQGGHEGFSLDLDELRLVQFDHDEPPV